MDVVAALDFGGTKIALATATPAGEILEQARIDTEPAGGAERALARAMEAARTLLARTGGRRLAVGAVRAGARVAASGVLRPGTMGAHTSGAPGTDVLQPLTRVGALPMALHPVMTFT